MGLGRLYDRTKVGSGSCKAQHVYKERINGLKLEKVFIFYLYTVNIMMEQR